MDFQNASAETTQQKSQKSRHLSILDFFENLQVEYIVADLRHKIYPKLKDKAYWNRVKDGKKATIEKLAEKNSLPSIFTDEAMLRTFEKKVYRDVSYPLFTYRDENHKLEQEFYDLKYYYNKGSDVRVDVDGDVLIGKISEEYIPFGTKLSVTINGAINKYSIKVVTRIL
jgi:hypothetical protein